MDTRTGEIVSPEEYAEIKKQEPARAQWMMEIPEEYLDKLEGMNRKERREFYRKHKKEWKRKLKESS